MNKAYDDSEAVKALMSNLFALQELEASLRGEGLISVRNEYVSK